MFIPCNKILKPHNVWECECEDCKTWRINTQKIREQTFERCKMANEAHKKAENSTLKFP